MPPAVSVLLPVYNGESYLSQAIESVLAQTFPDFELLISDDQSQDSSVAIAEQYARKDGRVRFWVNAERKGPFANYNQCLRQAQSAIIKPLAQDDILGPEMLATVMRTFECHADVVLVSTGKNLIDEYGQVFSDPQSTPAAESHLQTDRVLPGLEVVLKSILPVVNFVGEPTTVAFRKDAGREGFDESFYHLGDLDYWLRILLNGQYFYVSQKHCSFRVHSHSCTSANDRNLLFATDIIRLGRKLEYLFEPAGLTGEEFSKEALELIAGQVRYRVAAGKLSLADVKSQLRLCASLAGDRKNESQTSSAQMLEDLLFLQELVFHSLMSEPVPFPPVKEDVLADSLIARQESLVARREVVLRSLVESSPWRLTRWLRDLKKLAGGKLRTVSGGTGSAGAIFAVHEQSDRIDKIDAQRRYLRHLRRQIVAIRKSRSWRLVRYLRPV